MKAQDFDTLDVVRLEVGKRPPTYENLVKNPHGVMGAWGWLTPSPATQLTTTQTHPALQHQPPGAASATHLTFSVSDASTIGWKVLSEPAPVTPGTYAIAQLRVRVAPPGGTGVNVRIQWYDVNKAPLSVSSAGSFGATVAVNSTQKTPTVQVPASAYFASLLVELVWLATGPAKSFSWDRSQLAIVPQSTPGTPAFVEPYEYQDVLAKSHTIKTERGNNLSPGTLRATILDSTLDPSTGSTLIRPGAPVRLMAWAPDLSRWEPLFVGEVLNGSVKYDLTHRDAAKRSRIELSCVDPTKPVANASQPVGVRRVEELAFLLENVAVPWRVNQSTRQIPGIPVQVSLNENASVLDQVAITRDTTLGLAHFSRFGRLEVADAGMTDNAIKGVFTETDYAADIDVDYDMSRVINEVTVKDLSLDSEGKTVETIHGPYRNEDSIRKWGRFAAEYVRNTPEAFPPAQYAQVILNNNGTPTRGIRRLSFRVLKSGAVAGGDFRYDPNQVATGAYRRRVFLDVNDRVQATNVRAGLVDQVMRVETITHTITPKRWDVELGFAAAGGQPMPIPTAPVQQQLTAPAYFPGQPISRHGGAWDKSGDVPNNGGLYTTYHVNPGPVIPAGAKVAHVSMSWSCQVAANAAGHWYPNVRTPAGDVLLSTNRWHNLGNTSMNVGMSLTATFAVDAWVGQDLELYLNSSNDAGSGAWAAVSQYLHWTITYTG